MTRIESTSIPSSQTARTKRSTSTAVFPVPAPAETNTRPFASIAACCSGFGCQVTAESPLLPRIDRSLQTAARAKPARREGDSASGVSRPLHPAHRPEVAPRRALAALRIVTDVAGADVTGELAGSCSRRLDLRPERLFVEVVVPRVAREHVTLRTGAQKPGGAAPAGKWSVEPAERLDPDEVTQDEHVEGNLEPELLLHLPSRRRVLAGLVVLDDAPRAQRLHVDPVDLPREHGAVAEVEATLELGRRALHSERDLELTWLERRVTFRLRTNQALEVARERLLELLPLHLDHLEPDTAERLLETVPHEAHRILDLLRTNPVAAEHLRKALKELEECAVGDRAAQSRIDLRVDRLRVDQPVDEPGRGAVGKALELGDVEDAPVLQLLEHEWVCQLGGPPACPVCAVEPPLPAVRARERVGLVTPSLLGGEDRERAEPLGRPRAGGVEEIAVTRDRVGAAQARTETPALVVVEERGRRRAPRQRPLLQAEDEHVLEPARACAHEVDHLNTAGLRRRRLPHLRPFECRDEVFAGDVLGDSLPGFEIVQYPAAAFVGAKIVARVLVGRRAVEAVGGAEHRHRQLTHRLEWRGSGSHRVQSGQTRLAERFQLLLDSPGRGDRTATKPALDEVDAAALGPAPGKAKQRQQGLPVGGLAEAPLCLGIDRVGDTESPERGLDRAPPALERRHDDADFSRRGSGAEELENLLADELERASRTRAIEEADGTLDPRGRVDPAAEERPLEVGGRRGRHIGVAWTQLLERAAR